MGREASVEVAGRRIRRNRKAWQAVMRRYETSGQSQVAFCRSQGLALSSFSRWRQRLAAETGVFDKPVATAAAEAMFLEVQRPAVAVAPAGWELELQLAEGVVLRLRRAC